MQITKQERNNTGRQFELDLARGLAVIFMVFVHVMIVFANKHVADTPYGQVVDIFGGVPAAPVFMFLLGCGIVFSKKSDAKTLAKRGFGLFLSAYALNFFRSVLPRIIGEVILTATPKSFNEIIPNLYTDFFNVDILQFAGLAFLFFALLKWLRMNDISILGCLLLAMLLNQFIPHQKTGDLLSPITSLLVGGDEKLSFFPFITWISYPLAGYLFAHQLQKVQNKNRFYLLLGLISGGLFGLYFIIALSFDLSTGYESEYAYYFHGALINCYYVLFVLFWISMLYFISKKFNMSVRRFFEKMSRETSHIYIIHWIFIGFLALIFAQQENGLNMTIGLSIFIMIISYCTALIYTHLKRKKKR